MNTFEFLTQRRDYILKKMGKRYSVKWYMVLVTKITAHHVLDPSVGYCGEGDDSCKKDPNKKDPNKKETWTSKLVPDPDCINNSCWFHDRLYELVEQNLITYKMADKILKYSGYYDAQNKKGFQKAKGIIISRVYYRAVQMRTFFKGLF